MIFDYMVDIVGLAAMTTLTVVVYWIAVQI